MKLKSKDGEISPEQLRAEIYNLRDGKSEKSALGDLEKKLDKKNLKNALKRAINKREIFMYDGDFIPYSELMDKYDEISGRILKMITDLERTSPDGVDPVHIWDSESEKTLEFYQANDKINLSWSALIQICTEMGRRGEMEVFE